VPRERSAQWCDHLFLTGVIAIFGQEIRSGCHLALDGALTWNNQGK